MVMIESNNCSRYIKEVVTYYLSQGANQVSIYDHSIELEEEIKIKKALNSFIQKGQVSYVRDTIQFTEGRQRIMLMKRVHTFINETFDSTTKNNNNNNKQWLITVDDDELIYPDMRYLQQQINAEQLTMNISLISNRTLLNFLCSSPILQNYPVVNFRYRYVGTSNVQYPNDNNNNNSTTKNNKKNLLDMEIYTQMAPPPRFGKNDIRGKSAYHITHHKMSKDLWIKQDSNNNPYLNDTKRTGGVFFMHGNLFRYTEYEFNLTSYELRRKLKHEMILDAGYTYHMTRSKSEYYGRTQQWKELGKKRKNVDKNNVKDLILFNWARSNMINKGYGL